MSVDFSSILSALNDWLASEGWKVVAILIGSIVVHRILLIVLGRAVRRLVVRDSGMSAEAEEKREDTLIRILHSTIHVVLVVVVSMMLLSSFGIEIGPLIAAAGIVGLAFGFGGQYLIRDIISGLFMVLENQFRVGDVVDLDGTGGIVEDITLRMTTLRDLDGNVHHVPNGEVKRVTNKGKGFSRVNMNVGISYDADLDKVIEVVNRVGHELADDPKFKDAIIEAPQFSRVTEFAASSVDIKILGKVKPLKQWEITGELRKRIKQAFDRTGIEIPFPQMVMRQAPPEKK